MCLNMEAEGERRKRREEGKDKRERRGGGRGREEGGDGRGRTGVSFQATCFVLSLHLLSEFSSLTAMRTSQGNQNFLL